MLQNRKTSISECQPDYTGTPPASINKTMRRDEVLYVAGRGQKPCDVMFVAQNLEDDEAREVSGSNFGFQVKQPACYLKGDMGSMLRDCAQSVGINLVDHYYTAYIKWLLPKAERNNPSKEARAWAEAAFDREMQEVKPKVVVCLGKAPFDHLVNLRIKAQDALGAWFWSVRYQCRVYLMERPVMLLFKPERLDQFRVFFREVKAVIDNKVDTAVRDYTTVTNMAGVRALVEEWKAADAKVIATDCEWGGTDFIGGRLRTTQFCWREGRAAAIRFMDDKGNYVFDGTYAEVGAVLAEWLDRPDVKYVGHYISVDLPWLHKWLGLKWYGKTLMDTAFALQTVDESAPNGLEWLAMYTSTLGRYDLPLLMWKKANPQKESDGYAYIPDEILLSYSCGDVDATFHGYKWLLKKLDVEGVSDYYFNIFNPFVTDVFTSFVLSGLPVDRSKLESLRKVYNFTYGLLLDDFRKAVHIEAKFLFVRKCAALLPPEIRLQFVGKGLAGQLDESDLDSLDAKTKKAIKPFVEHLAVAPVFNIRSKPQMTRWIFEVKGHVPIKSTDNKNTGLRSIPWEKVLSLPPERQAEYQPATDKQTLQILAEKDPMIDQLFDLNVVGNICKSFLKEGVVDPDTGETISERGLFEYIAADGRIHNFYATTETGRPRTWKPNILNLPSYVAKRLATAIGRLLCKLADEGSLPEEMRRYLPDKAGEPAKVPSIRSCIVPPDGWCVVESDYQTAEVRALAYQSGDPTLIALMSEPDESFGLVKSGKDKFKVRLWWRPADECGIPLHAQDPECLMTIWKENADGTVTRVRSVSQEELLRDKTGKLVHPKHDLHWSLAEMVYEKPREKMRDKVERQVGKAGNFKTAYGGSESSLERSIEADTGRKPEPGTGKKILDALERRQPIAVDHLRWLENLPREEGLYVAASGRKRRFRKHPAMLSQDNWRMAKSLLSAMGREARNFPMQESVAATAARAGIWLLEFGRKCGLEGGPIAILYDSVVTICPEQERHVWALAHELYMYLANSWKYDGRTLAYPIDTEFNTGWSEKASGEVKERLADPAYKPTPPRLVPVLAWLRSRVQELQAA